MTSTRQAGCEKVVKSVMASLLPGWLIVGLTSWKFVGINLHASANCRLQSAIKCKTIGFDGTTTTIADCN